MRILFVDDTEDNINLYQIFLKNYDKADIEYTTKPDTAIKLMNENVYDLVFLDIEMPGKTGFDVLEEVTIQNEQKIYALTAYSDTDTVEKINEHERIKDILKVFLSIQVAQTFRFFWKT